MRYIIIFLFLSLFLGACENTRHSIGLTGKPLASDGKFEDTLKFQYKIISLAMACLITLIGWQLHETWSLKEQVFKLQQGQIVLSKQIKKNSAFVKQKLKQIKKKQNKKNIDKAIKKNNKKKKKKKVENE